MADYPGDIESRKTDSRACAIVHYQINADCWDYKNNTGHDVGTDCELELSEDGEWRGKKIEVQIKGTKNIGRFLINNKTLVSYPLAKKTIRYGLAKPNSFFLFVVDVVKEDVFIVELHDYFIEDADKCKQLASEAKEMSIHIPVSHNLKSFGADYLKEAAKKVFVGEPGIDLREAK